MESRYTPPPPYHMKKNHAVILILSLVVIFSIAFGYFLFKCCARAIKAEVYELEFRKDVEAGKKEGE
ncbi:hypothetical protein NX059_000225 [Plenodomus lindquistii]|nr:hypothetical protein NX059_000225 [Plenodomus lindquistii]